MKSSLRYVTRWLRDAAFGLTVVIPLVVASAVVASADSPVALRVQTLTVPPSTQPVMQIDVQNQTGENYTGSVVVQGPDGWKLSPASREVTLAAGEACAVPFSIDRGRNVASNQYTFAVTATSDLGETTRRQTTFVASAPYYKPTIDGRADEWKDAIPIAFASKGKTTEISTYWNRRQFSLLVAVQESELVPHNPDQPSRRPDAIQIAISPLDVGAASSPDDVAGRFEFLLVATDDGARCFQLASTDTPLEQLRQPRPLEGLACDSADVAVRRSGDVTLYECSLSFGPMRDEIRPMEGREFFMSVLVHDPDDTGLRDLGSAAGLWASPADADAWSRWTGGAWDEAWPRGNKVRWGLCTSKY